MDWLTFLAAVIDALAWPLAVVLAVIVLRRALNTLLPSLTHLKYKDLELRFGKEVAEARAAVEAAPERPALPAPPPEPPSEAAYFQSLADLSPRAAVLEAWLPFENTASWISERLRLFRPDRPPQMPRMIQELTREGILTEEEASAVSRLRALRNAVVHAPTVELSSTEVVEYAAVLRQVTHAMEQRFGERERPPN